MSVYKKANPRKLTRIRAHQSSLIFLFIALIALLSLWLPILFA
jgi:hypothetical protein